MKYKLLNTSGLSSAQILKLVNEGARFKLFKYQLALFAITFPRLSPAILIKNDDEFKSYKRKYNLITLFFGPWFFPTGPVNVASTIRFNNKGAIDATQDMLINLANYNEAEQIIVITKIYTLFDDIPKTDFKAIKVALKDYFSKNTDIKHMYVGRYINVQDNIEPPYFIGVETNLPLTDIETEIKALIYKKFNEFAHFEIFTVKENPELFERIKEQGQTLFSTK